MGEYFKPLRRRIGVVTLVMACVFAGGWVRSLTMLDLFTVATSNNLWRFTIEDGIVEFSFYQRVSGDPQLSQNSGWKSDSNVTPNGGKIRSGPTTANLAMSDTKLEFYSFAYAAKYWVSPTFAMDMYFFVFPYWSIVIPLTLLSAWLLLSKPRSKPANAQSSSGDTPP